MTNVPSATANTSKTQALTVSALDADNNTITGTYGDSAGAANPVTVTTNDTDANGVHLDRGRRRDAEQHA